MGAGTVPFQNKKEGITAAGPSPILTGFPVRLSKEHLSVDAIQFQASDFVKKKKRVIVYEIPPRMGGGIYKGFFAMFNGAAIAIPHTLERQ